MQDWGKFLLQIFSCLLFDNAVTADILLIHHEDVDLSQGFVKDLLTAENALGKSPLLPKFDKDYSMTLPSFCIHNDSPIGDSENQQQTEEEIQPKESQSTIDISDYEGIRDRTTVEPYHKLFNTTPEGSLAATTFRKITWKKYENETGARKHVCDVPSAARFEDFFITVDDAYFYGLLSKENTNRKLKTNQLPVMNNATDNVGEYCTLSAWKMMYSIERNSNHETSSFPETASYEKWVISQKQDKLNKFTYDQIQTFKNPNFPFVEQAELHSKKFMYQRYNYKQFVRNLWLPVGWSNKHFRSPFSENNKVEKFIIHPLKLHLGDVYAKPRFFEHMDNFKKKKYLTTQMEQLVEVWNEVRPMKNKEKYNFLIEKYGFSKGTDYDPEDATLLSDDGLSELGITDLCTCYLTKFEIFCICCDVDIKTMTIPIIWDVERTKRCQSINSQRHKYNCRVGKVSKDDSSALKRLKLGADTTDLYGMVVGYGNMFPPSTEIVNVITLQDLVDFQSFTIPSKTAKHAKSPFLTDLDGTSAQARHSQLQTEIDKIDTKTRYVQLAMHCMHSVLSNYTYLDLSYVDAVPSIPQVFVDSRCALFEVKDPNGSYFVTYLGEDTIPAHSNSEFTKIEFLSGTVPIDRGIISKHNLFPSQKVASKYFLQSASIQISKMHLGTPNEFWISIPQIRSTITNPIKVDLLYDYETNLALVMEKLSKDNTENFEYLICLRPFDQNDSIYTVVGQILHQYMARIIFLLNNQQLMQAFFTQEEMTNQIRLLVGMEIDQENRIPIPAQTSGFSVLTKDFPKKIVITAARNEIEEKSIARVTLAKREKENKKYTPLFNIVSYYSRGIRDDTLVNPITKSVRK